MGLWHFVCMPDDGMPQTLVLLWMSVVYTALESWSRRPGIKRFKRLLFHDLRSFGPAQLFSNSSDMTGWLLLLDNGPV